jgi:nucleotide-binding universal stress UspA family protein
MKTIIVPTDFSDNADNAVKYAIQMSKMHYNKLIFVHVFSLPFLNPEAGMVYDQSFFDAQRIQADKALRESIDKVYKSLGMHRNLLLSELEVVEAISLSSGIQKLHLKYQANMIIMGTHGATGLKKFFLGSNAVDVIENVSIPVLSVPEHCLFEKMKNIAYCSDFTDIESELYKVVDFAKSFAANVDVMHIAMDLAHDVETDPIIKKWQLTNNYDKINLHLVQGNENSNVDQELKTLLVKIDVDLLVVFHQQRNFWKTLFEKSTTAELVYEWTNPILTMQKNRYE